MVQQSTQKQHQTSGTVLHKQLHQTTCVLTLVDKYAANDAVGVEFDSMGAGPALVSQGS
jgi:hypothetical protein